MRPATKSATGSAEKEGPKGEATKPLKITGPSSEYWKLEDKKKKNEKKKEKKQKKDEKKE